MPASDNASSSSRAGQPKNILYTDLMKPDEDWRLLPEASERRKVQNRLAQRAYRRNMRERTKQLESLKNELAKFQNREAHGEADSTAAAAAAAAVEEETQSMAHQQQQSSSVEDEECLDQSGTVDDSPMVAQWCNTFPTWTQGIEPHVSYMEPTSFTPPPPQNQRKTASKTWSGPQAESASDSSRSQRGASSSTPQPSRHGRKDSKMTMPPRSCPSPSQSHTPVSSGLQQGTMRSPDQPVVATMAELQQANQFFAMQPGASGIAPDPMSFLQLDPNSGFPLDGIMGVSRRWRNLPSNPNHSGFWTGASPQLSGDDRFHGSYFSTPQHESASSTSSPGSPMSHQTASTLTSSSTTGEDTTGSGDDDGSASGSNQGYTVSAGTTQPQYPSSTSHPSTPLSYQAIAAQQSNSTQQSSLLHLAVASGHPHVLKMLLLRCEIPLDVCDEAGYTALQQAVITGRSEMVALLLEAGADPSAGQDLKMVEEPSPKSRKSRKSKHHAKK